MTDNKRTNPLPMTPDDMTTYLIQQNGRPCALREEGTDTILCPYCGELHYHPDAHGHYRAICADEHQCPSTQIIIGSRSFNPAYGYDIYEYKKIVSDNTTHYEIKELD